MTTMAPDVVNMKSQQQELPCQPQVEKFATNFKKSLTLSEPEAEQSFNETSDDSSF